MHSPGVPLCPAGHLPLKGGDWPSPYLSPFASVAERAQTPTLLISPEGEMSGRTEGGASHYTSLLLETVG
ncbi:lytic murein transglycosylase [Mesorhizobium sp. M7A.F.Ca.CA.001.07.2.1]|nr:lytic murein transglycosylase [Mesorhizobium sp. M7A.F.Ca.CA.004.08.2.1]RUX89778.1 lytic murein transglycosylase [Mesorhizobium sp. M7A.F.Ca.CA.004.08.1.1]RUY07413.1 lytic murein transglycosylase [Mesorhizobium sp. M7A.F.Ca.CA.004.04.1.1]RUY26033.1 lytic murein transglycosylase [Mesorhizobium sp. M7A.F.Ca.CA.004.12.1.1]RUY58883.1 lytic murein transglycosylase [Mesorhizobium sp. M7A.F.Ca.CA.001.12.1.1]RUY83720.1 lytic murein transglycosylase [Mesorhizobium sp. M7A.F.Ca.CA.001.10.2.1]RUZ5214